MYYLASCLRAFVAVQHRNGRAVGQPNGRQFRDWSRSAGRWVGGNGSGCDVNEGERRAEDRYPESLKHAFSCYRIFLRVK
jgi:hypothetical protein